MKPEHLKLKKELGLFHSYVTNKNRGFYAKTLYSRQFKLSKNQLIELVKAKFPEEDFSCLHLFSKTTLIKLAYL